MKTIVKILLAPLFWLLQACSPLGDRVDEKKSDNHYYNKSNSEIRFSPKGNWFELGDSPMDADVESFKVLNRHFGKDKNAAYYGANSIEKGSIDLASFHVKDNEYMDYIALDKNHVYTFEKVYGKSNKSLKPNIVTDADPKTYIHSTFEWAKDARHHFYRFKKIVADYDTFENLNDTFSKDKNTIYHHYGDEINPINADLASFEVLGKAPIAKDKYNVYCMQFKKNSKNELISISRSTSDSVENLNDIYIRVGDSIYYWGSLVVNAEAKSFEIVSFNYAKDAKNVFHKGKLLIDADLATFRVLKNGRIGDKNGPFRNGERE